MIFIFNLVRKLIPNKLPNPVLGRWKLESCHKKVDHKIDLSNEDHCGPCGQYALQKAQEYLRPKNTKVAVERR